MSDDLPMDDNLRGLLVELAQHPEELALGARVRRFQDLLRPDAIVLRPGTGVGAIEAKLLEAHRDELARLLLQASQIRIAKAVLLSPRDSKGNPRPVDPVNWRRTASSYVNSSIADAKPLGPLSLLKRVLAPRGGHPTPLELAIASLRLVPRIATTIWVGVHCGLAGDRERGIQVHRSVLDDLTSRFHSAYAWNNIAWLSHELGRFQDALEAGRQAALVEPEMTRGPIAWFLAAVQVGSQREATRAAAMLSDAAFDHLGALQEYVEVMRKGRERGSWTPTAASQVMVQKLSGRIPLLAERLLQVFAPVGVQIVGGGPPTAAGRNRFGRRGTVSLTR